MLEARPYLLDNSIQHYSWGTKNESAFIPKLLGIKAKEDVHYAELWMGAHPSAPSQIKFDDKSVSLHELVQSNPEMVLGERVMKKFGNTIPFLFKVLSAGEILSIQTHPNKTQAKYLHEKDPVNYPDENHKPEIAIALDSLKALVGFKDDIEFKATINRYPALIKYLGAENIDQSTEKLFKKIVTKFDPTDVNSKSLIDSIRKQIEEETEFLELSEEEILFVELFNKYGYDVGLIALLLMHLVELSEGEALFTPAGIPHAYIEGNIIECMANSDNVLRLGLTPKFKDVTNLVDVIDFSENEIPLVMPVVDGNKKIYRSDADEFCVTKFECGANEKVIESNTGPAIILCVDGKCNINWEGDKELQLKRGTSCFIPAALAEYEIVSGTNCTLFRAEVP